MLMLLLRATQYLQLAFFRVDGPKGPSREVRVRCELDLTSLPLDRQNRQFTNAAVAPSAVVLPR